MNLLHNATIIDSGKRFRGYLAFENEYITHVGCGNVPQALVELAGSNIADMHGAYIIPGVIDDQVHFRDPGLTHKGDIATESAAAAAGGVTSFMDMPNTNPSTTTVADLERKLDRANAVSTVNYSLFFRSHEQQYRRVAKGRLHPYTWGKAVFGFFNWKYAC